MIIFYTILIWYHDRLSYKGYFARNVLTVKRIQLSITFITVLFAFSFLVGFMYFYVLRKLHINNRKTTRKVLHCTWNYQLWNSFPSRMPRCYILLIVFINLSFPVGLHFIKLFLWKRNIWQISLFCEQTSIILFQYILSSLFVSLVSTTTLSFSPYPCYL